MKRPGTVVGIAVVEFTGSGLMLAMAAVMAMGAMVAMGSQAAPQAPPPMLTAGMFAVASALYLLPAAWGVVTALGMLRMRFWALVSTLVFAYGLLWGGGAVATAAITAPVVATGPAAAVMLRLMLGGISMTGLGIAIWFLAYGGRQAVRAQFLGGRVWRTRPLSVSLLGWAFGVGACLATPLILLVSRPVLPLGPVHLIGAFAKAGFVLLAGIALAAAVGLLRLRPWGRTAGLVIIAVLLVSVASDLAPLTRFRSELGAALAGPGAYGANLAGSYWWLDSLGMVITLLLGGYFLYSRRSAFYRAPALLAKDETALTR